MCTIQQALSVVSNLIYHHVSFPTHQTPQVCPLLEALKNELDALALAQMDAGQTQATLYDLLLITTLKIEPFYTRPAWTINTLLALLDKCLAHESMPSEVKRNDPFHRGALLHRHLSAWDKLKLGQLAYERAQSWMTKELRVSLWRIFKLSVGNIAAGKKNLALLLQLHPYLVQLRLPIGALKEELHGFINTLGTVLLTYPKVNDQPMVLSLNNKFESTPSMSLDYHGILVLITLITSPLLVKSRGESADDLDVILVRTQVALLKQLRGNLLELEPNPVALALVTRPVLRAHVNTMIPYLSQLTPVYTWGGALDEQFNGFLDEIKHVCDDLAKLPEVKKARELSPPWNLMNALVGAEQWAASLAEMICRLVDVSIPAFIKESLGGTVAGLIPDFTLSAYVEAFKKPVIEAKNAVVSLISEIRTLGLYDPVTQAFLEVIRRDLTTMDLSALHKVLATYRDQFEIFIEPIRLNKQDPIKLWASFPPAFKNELLLNLAYLLMNLRHLINSLLPILDPVPLSQMRHALSNHPASQKSFEQFVTQLIALQSKLSQDSMKLREKVQKIFDQPSEVMTLKSILQSVLGQNTGTLASTVATPLISFQLDLSFNPSKGKVEGIPITWDNLSLKNILNKEIMQFLLTLDRFNALELEAPKARVAVLSV